MKIVMIGYMHGRGGIQTHTRFLAEGLRARGHRVFVISPAPMAGHDLKEQSPDFRVYAGLVSLIGMIREFGPDIAVVVGTGWKAMLGVFAARQSCRKVFFEVMSGARAKFLDPRLLSRTGFHAIVGQGVPVTKRFIKEFGWHGRAETIPALPEALELAYEIPERRSVPLGVGGSIRFAFFSRLASHKRADLLIEHWCAFAPAGSTMDIWGAGPEAERLEEMIRQRGLEKAISLRGRYPDGSAYINLLQSYDLLLLPTVGDEGAPLVLLEAMACGLPFVANGVGGIPDYANPDCAITSGEISEFLPAVRQMIERLQVGDIDPVRLQEHYQGNYSFERLVSRWENFLKSCVARNNVSRSRTG